MERKSKKSRGAHRFVRGSNESHGCRNHLCGVPCQCSSRENGQEEFWSEAKGLKDCGDKDPWTPSDLAFYALEVFCVLLMLKSLHVSAHLYRAYWDS